MFTPSFSHDGRGCQTRLCTPPSSNIQLILERREHFIWRRCALIAPSREQSLTALVVLAYEPHHWEWGIVHRARIAVRNDVFRDHGRTALRAVRQRKPLQDTVESFIVRHHLSPVAFFSISPSQSKSSPPVLASSPCPIFSHERTSSIRTSPRTRSLYRSPW